MSFNILATGTGKSLSLICGALTWLKYFETKRIEDLTAMTKEEVAEEDEEDDWISANFKKREQEEQRHQLKVELKFLLEKVQRIKDLRKSRSFKTLEKDFDELFEENNEVQDHVRKELLALQNGLTAEDNDIILDDYYSDEESTDDHDGWEDEKPKDYSLRIFYCSRTHSQLSQFVKEVQKTKFATDIRLVSLASRSNMCINDSVLSLKNPTLINERCLEMQKKKTTKKALANPSSSPPKKRQRMAKSASCQYYKSSAIAKLRDIALLEVHDIEDIVAKGREVKACPYYANRKAVEDAQVVVVPYNTLLHQATREACHINLDNSVVIIDEAHNLLETIASIHSGEILESHISSARDQLKSYVKRFGSMFSASNKLYLKQLDYVLAKLNCTFKNPVLQLMSFGEFLCQLDLSFNLLKVIKYVEKSKLCYKLQSYSKKSLKEEGPSAPKGVSAFLATLNKDATKVPEKKDESSQTVQSTTSCPMLYVLAFLQSLVRKDTDLKVLVDHKKKSLKVILLNPASQFKDLVAKCRSIIVAGGTMQPISEFEDQLFKAAGAIEQKIDRFTCGHIVSKENVLPLVVKCGPKGQTLDFTYQNRDKVQTYEELALALIQICKAVPGGIVVFFPSYDYENRVFNHFQKANKIQQIEKIKKVFREPRKTIEMEQVLKNYSRHARLGQGALLLSVVGGKMSEGINFGDDLGRAVVMVGLPFPNKDSPELKQKIAYLNKTVAASAGSLHYENLCMKAVNQSIGRAIRHKNDYAAMILLDHRYERPNIVSHLPQWIRGQVQVVPKFDTLTTKLIAFFKEKSCSINS